MGNLPHVHGPHESVHSLRDFFVHIAIVAIGLLLAIGLEQTVEAVHHRRQVVEFEQAMFESLDLDYRTAIQRQTQLSGFADYLIDIRSTLASGKDGRPGAATPNERDPRNNAFAPPSTLGPLQAARANGTLALLSLDRIRIYERLEFQHSLMLTAFQNFFAAMERLQSFRQRFDLPAPRVVMGIAPIDPTTLSVADLAAYRTIIGDAIEATRQYVRMIYRLNAASRAVLDGASNEAALIDAVARDPGASAVADR